MGVGPGSKAGKRRSSDRRAAGGAGATFVLGAGLLAAGAAFGLPALYVPAVALLILVTVAAAWVVLATHGARVERLPGPATVVEGDPYPLRIHLRPGVLPPRGELVEPLLEDPVPISLLGGKLRVGVSRAGVRLTEEARFPRRGRQRPEPARLVVADPLGLCSREVRGDGAGEVLVLPRVEPVLTGGDASGEGDLPGRGDGSGGSRGHASDAEIDGLREYRRGSPASRIHWAAVARHGELVERRLVSGDAGAQLVVLDAERPADPEALDRAVRAAASLCVHLARAGGCALLIPGSPRPLRIDPQLRGWARAHARLALVEAGGSVAAGFRAAAGRTTFWVTAAAEGGGVPALRRASFLVTPFPNGRGPTAFMVAGCHGIPVEARARSRSSLGRAA